jgi:alginate O-acetyltransferase complex protein AlgJ
LFGISGSFANFSFDRNGEFQRSIDGKINNAIPGERLNALLAGLEYKFLNDAGAWVRPGCTDWLFLAEELREYPGGNANIEKRLQIARRLIRSVAARHAVLIILPVPDKSDLARNTLCGAAISTQARKRKSRWFAGMTSEEMVRQVNVSAGWPAPGFLRTDSHWDTNGAQFAAHQLAAAITDKIGSQPTKVTLDRLPATTRPGDLIRLADLEASYAWSGPHPDQVRPVAANVTFAGGLLDRPSAPRIVLAGSSFSLNSNFLDFLQFELQEPVLQRSKEGAGFAGALLEVLHDKSAMLASAKAIVWEFPLRALTPPLTPEEERFLSRDF